MSSDRARGETSERNRRFKRNGVSIGSGTAKTTGSIDEIDLGFGKDIKEIQLDDDFSNTVSPKKDVVGNVFRELNMNFGFDDFADRRSRTKKNFF